jgi:hypothetical protein
MCDINGISDVDMNWEGCVDTKEEFTAELYGQKRKIAILNEDAAGHKEEDNSK